LGFYSGFGLVYGHVLQDRLLSVLLALFGAGFAAAGVPVELGDEGAPLSKAHVVAICLGLAAWLFGLARMAHLRSLGNAVHSSANLAATLLVLPIVGHGMQLWPMPVTHRLVFLVVFGWLAITSARLLRDGKRPPFPAERQHAASGTPHRR
jgi:hypothetical protein